VCGTKDNAKLPMFHNLSLKKRTALFNGLALGLAMEMGHLEVVENLQQLELREFRAYFWT